MPIRGLNHAVLWVRDAARSCAFYVDVLGFRAVHTSDRAVFLQAPDSHNDHDLGLFTLPDATAAPSGSVGLYHLAWEVPTLADLQTYLDALTAAGALVGSTDHGTTKALYAKDPDGLEFEICWLVPQAQITDISRFGADTPGESARIPA